MQTRPNKLQFYLVTASLLVCLVAVIFEYFAIQGLSVRADKLQDLAYSNTQNLRTHELQLEKQQAQIESLSKLVALEGSALPFPNREQLDALQPGIYILTTDTKYDPTIQEAATYQITHVRLDMNFDSFGTKLNIGLASSGMIPKGVYFDYDNDGQVDVDMFRDFAREIPIVGRRLAKAYDPVIAQNLYSIFVDESEKAEYTSIDDLAEDAEAKSNYLWSFVINQYEHMETWIRDRLEDSQSGD
jgi:hypothetical protein